MSQLSMNLNFTHKFSFGFVLRETGLVDKLACPRYVVLDICEFVTGCESTLA